MSYRL